jgi:ABC-type dipeptide/oligopeptide/nickel transport system permease subunit
VTKTALLIILFAPIAAIVIGLIAIYYAFKVDQEMFSGELDFDTVDF